MLAEQVTAALLAFLHSPPPWHPCVRVQHMGVARVECRSGCSCDASRLDGSWSRQVSLQQIHMFKARRREQGAPIVLASCACPRQVALVEPVSQAIQKRSPPLASPRLPAGVAARQVRHSCDDRG